jgi:hypothetical protein
MTETSLLTSRRLALLAFWLLLSGCGSGEVRGRIAGRVTFEGQPVTEGRVVFTSVEKGVHMTAKINADGHYEVNTVAGPGLPLATYQVSVSPPPAETAMGVVSTKPKPNEYSNIPKKYRYPKTSGLTLALQKGENTLDIDMK